MKVKTSIFTEKQIYLYIIHKYNLNYLRTLKILGTTMRITSQISDKFSIVKFDVDQVLGYEAQEFQDAILSSLDKNAKVIIVDLSPVKYISSWGIGMLIHGLTTTTNRGGSFKIVGLAENVMRVFQKVKIDTVLDIYQSVETAKASA